MFSDYDYGNVPQDAIDQLKLAYSNPYSGNSSVPRNFARFKKAAYNGPFQISSYQLKSDPNFSAMNYQPNGSSQQQQQQQYYSQTPNQYSNQNQYSGNQYGGNQYGSNQNSANQYSANQYNPNQYSANQYQSRPQEGGYNSYDNNQYQQSNHTEGAQIFFYGF